MIRSSFVLSALVLTLFVRAKGECDMCFFTTQDAEDCKVYGKIDGRLVAWTRASQECLDSYNVKINGVDPFSVGCDPRNVNTFVNNGVKAGSLENSVRAGLGVAEGGFFEMAMSGSQYVLKDSITVDGQSYDCNESESACYNAMKGYFEVGGQGESEMDQVCDKILGQVAVDKEFEQSNVRNLICQDVQAGRTPACETLGSEVQVEVDAATAGRDCVFVAFGPGSTTIPGCEGGDPQGGRGGGSGSAIHSPQLALATLFAVAFAVLQF